LSPRYHHSMLRSLHPVLPQLIVLAVSLALGACDGSESPLAPAEESLAPESEATAPDYLVTSGTSRIVFTSARTGGYDIFKMDPQGYHVLQLTKSAYAGEPAWSQTNSRIAMVRERLDANKTSHTDIYVINADGSNGHWARPTPFPYHLRYPSWSPDGSRILLTVQQMGKPYLAWLVLATGQVKFITSGGSGVQGNYPSYDPTGTKIIFVGPNGQTVEQMNLDGTGRKTLILSTTLLAVPRFSPDGKKIVFQRLSGYNVDIWVKNLVDGSVTRLTTDLAYDGQPSWSPDGSKIAFMSDRSGKAQIWTMSANGGNQVRITNTATAEKDPAWSH